MAPALVFRLALVLAALLLAVTAADVRASAYVQYGVQDDAWLLSGNGTLPSRLATLDRLGVDLVRVTVRWDQVARTRPADARDPLDPAYDWSAYDAAFDGLRSRGIGVLVSIWGTPAWANGGRAANWAPSSRASLAAFVYAASKRYPWIHRWAVWNEPNLRMFLRPTSPALYTARLLNPAYAALKSASRANEVAGGVTAPRGGEAGVSPVTWIHGMRAAHARLDAYAQNPYPLSPRETPTSGGCMPCSTFTISTISTISTVWGQVRPGRGVRAYRLQRFGGGGWRSVGGTARTSSRGFFTRVLSAPRGAKLRLWSPSLDMASPSLVVA